MALWPIPDEPPSYEQRIHSSPTTVHCFDNGYEGKQPEDLKEYLAKYLLKEPQESMNRYTVCRAITRKK